MALLSAGGGVIISVSIFRDAAAAAEPFTPAAATMVI